MIGIIVISVVVAARLTLIQARLTMVLNVYQTAIISAGRRSVAGLLPESVSEIKTNRKVAL